MKLYDIYNDPTIVLVEEKIISWYLAENYSLRDEQYSEAICDLLAERAYLYRKKTVLDTALKSVLADFNQSLIDYLRTMYNQCISAYQALSTLPNNTQDLVVEARCYLGEIYPPMHPVQSIRTRQMWRILTDRSSKRYNDFYCSQGVMTYIYGGQQDSEHKMLYLSENLLNWNEGLDRSFTDDMNLCYGFHNLYDHTNFTLLDIIWARAFEMQLCWEMHSANYDNSDVEEVEDLEQQKI